MLSLAKSRGRRAVAYYRHSAEDKQENSVAIQKEQTEKFAREEGIEIIHYEADEGVSGLTSNRPSFRRLFAEWVENPDAPPFDFVLVLEVSRWGRFQKGTEGPYHEHRCFLQGKEVVYADTGFAREDQRFMYGVQHSLKQEMASEFSRGLSVKVHRGSVKVSQQGYSAGGTACYGMARLLLSESKEPIRVLKKGEHKQIANERVTFIPLGDETNDIIREIFHLVIDEWKMPEEIADILNGRGISAANGAEWNRQKVINILSNETYAGTRLYNKTWSRLKEKQKKNPYSEWVVKRDAFPAIVPLETFVKAQERLYWMLPARYKRGVYAIRKARKLAHEIAGPYLQAQGLTEVQFEIKLQEIPVLFSVVSKSESTQQWCFVIPEQVRKKELVLGISISLEHTDIIDQAFLIPTTEFSATNLMLLSEKDPRFSGFHIERDAIEDKLVSLL